MSENLHVHLGFRHSTCPPQDSDALKPSPVNRRWPVWGSSWVRCHPFSHPRQSVLLSSLCRAWVLCGKAVQAHDFIFTFCLCHEVVCRFGIPFWSIYFVIICTLAFWSLHFNSQLFTHKPISIHLPWVSFFFFLEGTEAFRWVKQFLQSQGS